MKKQALRRLLSLILCLVMCLTLLPASVFADSEIADEPVEAAVPGEPEAPGEAPEEPAEEPEEPAQEPEEPAQEPEEPEAEPEEPAEEPEEHAEEPEEPAEEPEEPEEPAEPADEPEEPAEEITADAQDSENVKDEAADLLEPDPANGTPQYVTDYLKLGTKINPYVSPDTVVYYAFVPTVTSVYIFESSDNGDTYGYLYGPDWKLLARDDDSSDYNANFRIEYTLEKDKTYYFGFRYYFNGSDYQGYLPVLLKIAGSGWQKFDGKWYYIMSSGALAVGWQEIGSATYFFFSDGSMAADGGHATSYDYATDTYTCYYFKPGGACDKSMGWKKNSSGEWFYVSSDGTLLTGWNTVGKAKYYFSPVDGYMFYDGVCEIDSKLYFFNADGSLGKAGWNKLVYSYTWTDKNGGTQVSSETEWYYLNSDGSVVEGWKRINGKWYYFSYEGYGRMVSGGVYPVDGKNYFFDSSGALADGGWKSVTEVTIDAWGNKISHTDWFYTNSDGTAVSGWKKINGSWYYFYPGNFAMYAGMLYPINGKIYFFTESGALAKEGWQKLNLSTYDLTGHLYTVSYWYYTDSGGVVLSGWNKISGKWYYFGNDGPYGLAMCTGLTEIEGKYYFFDNGTGAMQKGWCKDESVQSDSFGNSYTHTTWYYAASSGELQTGWLTIGGKKYYFDPSYLAMVANDVWRIDETYYFFTSSGALAGAGWQSIKSTVNGVEKTNWYYANADGSLFQGWKKIGGVWYYFSPMMLSGGLYWISEEYPLEYFKPSGAWVPTGSSGNGWRDVGGTMRYVENGEYVKGWKKIDDQWYCFDSSGDVHYGWVESNGKKYYVEPEMLHDQIRLISGESYSFSSSGAMQTGWIKRTYKEGDQTLKIWYYAVSTGQLVYGWYNINGKQYYFSPGMYADGTYLIDGYYYTFNANGVCTGMIIDS